MSPKRGDDVAAPTIDGEWRLKFATNEAASGWQDLVSQEPRSARRCWEALRANPLSAANPDRQHRLRGRLANGAFGGKEYPQWEYEVTAGGRVRYLFDEDQHVVRFVYASTRHPKDTE